MRDRDRDWILIVAGVLLTISGAAVAVFGTPSAFGAGVAMGVLGQGAFWYGRTLRRGAGVADLDEDLRDETRSAG